MPASGAPASPKSFLPLLFGGALGLAACLSLSGCDGPARTASAAGAFEEAAAPESLSSFTLRWLLGVGMGHKLHYERLQIYYLDPVTEEQARSTGQFLHRLGLGQRDSLVQVRRNADSSPAVYELRIGTTYSRQENIDREMRSVFQMMALSAEGAVFEGAPVHVYLCDSTLKPLLILRPRLKSEPTPPTLSSSR